MIEGAHTNGQLVLEPADADAGDSYPPGPRGAPPLSVADLVARAFEENA